MYVFYILSGVINVLILTMMCVFVIFFICSMTISSRNNASIFNVSILFDRKQNLVGALKRSKFPVIFKSDWKSKIKINEKRDFFTENRFSIGILTIYSL